MPLYPKLRPGVEILQLKNSERPNVGVLSSQVKRFFVGFSHRGVQFELALANPRAIILGLTLSLLDGRQSDIEIVKIISKKYIESGFNSNGLNLADFLDGIFQPLKSAKLLDLFHAPAKPGPARPGPVKSGLVPPQSAELAQNKLNYEARLRPEINLISFEPEVALDLAAHIKERENFAITIFGSNRLAISLYAILQASGYSRTKLLQLPCLSKQITSEQVCGLTVRSSDIGLKTKDLLEEIDRGTQLNHLVNGSTSDSTALVISTQKPAPDFLAGWMGEGIPHLLVSNMVEGKVELGPLVIPGSSPCMRCIELWKSQSRPHQQAFELLSNLTPALEIPSAAVALLAGLITLQVSNYVATGESKLIGTSVVVDLLNPLGLIDPTFPKKEYWQPHFECGCQSIHEAI